MTIIISAHYLYPRVIYYFQVTISDNGFPTALLSTTKVVVTVDDANDNAPQFDKALYAFKIPESKRKTLPVREVSAKLKLTNLNQV